jgi:anti-sigma B factor antagonist
MYALEISSTQQNGVIIIRLIGDINSDTAPILESELLSQARKHHRIILDISGVINVSSIGFRKILMLYRNVRVHNGQVLLAGMSEDLRRVMWASGFLNYFIVAETVEMGLAAYE